LTKPHPPAVGARQQRPLDHRPRPVRPQVPDVREHPHRHVHRTLPDAPASDIGHASLRPLRLPPSPLPLATPRPELETQLLHLDSAYNVRTPEVKPPRRE